MFSTVFKNKKIAQNLAFSMSEAAYFPESWPFIFEFLTLYYILLDADPVPVMRSGSDKAKSYASCCGSGSGSTNLVTTRVLDDTTSVCPGLDQQRAA
jgi:hypothetical protein